MNSRVAGKRRMWHILPLARWMHTHLSRSDFRELGSAQPADPGRALGLLGVPGTSGTANPNF